MAVTQATDAEFHELLARHDKVLVKYHADWCGSCRLFSPKFKRLSERKENQVVAFLDVNAETNPEARRAAGVDNLPFFAAFRGGELVGTAATSEEDAVAELLRHLN